MDEEDLDRMAGPAGEGGAAAGNAREPTPEAPLRAGVSRPLPCTFRQLKRAGDSSAGGCFAMDVASRVCRMLSRARVDARAAPASSLARGPGVFVVVLSNEAMRLFG